MELESLDESVVNVYLSALLWSETLDAELVHDGTTYAAGKSLDEVIGIYDLPAEVIKEAREDLELWREKIYKDTGVDPFAEGAFDVQEPDDVARHLALTRNYHGAGFWDSIWARAGDEYLMVRYVDYAGKVCSRPRAWGEYLTEQAHNLGSVSLDVWIDDSTGELAVAIC